VIWVAYGIVMVAFMGTLAWLWQTLERALFDRERAPDQLPPGPPPQAPRGSLGASERLELPPGPEGHLMAAQAIERAATMYVRACEERMR
jgi:hypothetical protein